MEFFHDFLQLGPDASADSAQQALEGLIQLPGWLLSVSDEQRKPFASKFVALGVLFGLQAARDKIVGMRNKPGRVESIATQVEEVFSDMNRKLQFKEALPIRAKIR